MPARRTKYPFHSKCGRKARLFPREVLHSLAEKARQHSEQFTNGYFFRSSSLFSCSISFETTGIAHLKKQNKKTNLQFSHKNKLRVLCGYDSNYSRYPMLSEPSWLRVEAGPLPALQPCAWNAEFGATRGPLRNALPGHLPSRSDQNKALYAGPLYFSHLLERGQPQVEVLVIAFDPASAILDLSVEQWKVTDLHDYPDLLPLRMGHKPSKQMHNSRTKLYLGSRRNLRKFHSRPVSLPGLWLAPESATFWLIAQECRKESVCRVYWPD